MPFLTEEDKETLMDMRHAVWRDPLLYQMKGSVPQSPATSHTGSPFPFGLIDGPNTRDSILGSGSDSR